jgi:hypothetical protein
MKAVLQFKKVCKSLNLSAGLGLILICGNNQRRALIWKRI